MQVIAAGTTLNTSRLQAENQIFTLATTRINLETQLLALQATQTSSDMARITALQTLVTQMQSMPLGSLIAGLTAGTLGGPLQTLFNAAPGSKLGGQTPTVPGANALDTLAAAAYGDRGSLGYGNFRGANL
jgi:hypothetical protein